MSLTSFLWREPCQHLVENVVILLILDLPHHPGLVEEVAMDLGPVQGTIGHLHLDEVALAIAKRAI